MIKNFGWMLVVTLGLSLTITGCGNKGRVSTSDLQSSFKLAEPAMQTLVDKTVGAVKSNNYPEALSDLQVLSHKARLTPDQQQSINDTVAAIQKHVSDVASKAAADSQKTTGNPQKSLPK
jgi:hypothetical protein